MLSIHLYKWIILNNVKIDREKKLQQFLKYLWFSEIQTDLLWLLKWF